LEYDVVKKYASVADLESDAGGEAPKARASSAEPPKARGGWGVGRGYPPHHRERGLERVLGPLPRNFFRFLS